MVLERLLSLFASEEPIAEGSEEDRLRLAAAVIFLEAATADDEFSPEECRRVLDGLAATFRLNPDEAEDLLVAAQDRQSENNVLWRCTREINERCSLSQKLRIMEETWRVIYADGVLEAHEDYFVHKLARLLNLTHPQLIDAKMRVLAQRKSG